MTHVGLPQRHQFAWISRELLPLDKRFAKAEGQAGVAHMLTPAKDSKPPRALVIAWLLMFSMLSGYWLLYSGYTSVGLSLLAISAFPLAGGSLIFIVVTLLRNRSSFHAK